MTGRDRSAFERSRFVEDLLSYMTLEEKLGQLNLFHAPTDPALERAIAAGRVGGVADGTSPARLQALATERSRLGIPLLLANSIADLTLSPWALAASWDEELAHAIGAEVARDNIGGGFNCMTVPRTGHAIAADGADLHVAACEPYLAAILAAAFADGASSDDDADQRSAVLAIPSWESAPGLDSLAWSQTLINTGKVNAFDCAVLDRTAAQHGGFAGILVSECQRIFALVRRQFAVTSARSTLESAERLITDGLVSELEIDMAVRGVLAAKHRLGLFREPQRVIAPPAVGLHYSRDDQKVRATFILLRNEAGILPLSPVSDRVLVVGAAEGVGGACADALGRAGIGHAIAPGLAQRRPEETWATPIAGDHLALSLTMDAARRADFALVVLEDRHFARSTENDWRRPTAAALAMLHGLSLGGSRLIAIIATHDPVDLAQADQYFAAALQCWQPTAGFEEALSDVLSGRFSPQGRMPVSAGRFLAGHGLGFGDIVLSNYALVPDGDRIVGSVRARNSGSFPARETVQFYRRGAEGTVRLIAFEHVTLAPGEETRLSIEFGLEALGTPAVSGRLEMTPGRYEILAGKSASRLLPATVEITPALARAIMMRERGFLRLAAG